MTCFKFSSIFFMVGISSLTLAELTQVSDQQLDKITGQSGITLDQIRPLSATAIELDLTGSEALTVISGNRHDNNPANDRLLFNSRYRGLTLDITDAGQLSIGLPHYYQIGELNPHSGELENGLSLALYASQTSEISATQYSSRPQDYTAYINTISDRPDYDRFTLTMTGGTFIDGSTVYQGNYQENQNNSNIDGASVRFRVSGPGQVSFFLQSNDRRCTLFGGCDRGEIIIVDKNGDLVARAGSPDSYDARLDNVAVRPERVIEQQGSNFYISADLTASFRFSGRVNISTGAGQVENRY